MPRRQAVEWRPIVGSPGYEVSAAGEVRNPRGRVLKAAPNSKGYLKVSLTRRRQEYVHRLVAMAFHPVRAASRTEVDHVNQNQADNRAANLRWLDGTSHCEASSRWVWVARTPDGRNVWSDQRHAPPPEDFEPMSDEELRQWSEELEREGWV